MASERPTIAIVCNARTSLLGFLFPKRCERQYKHPHGGLEQRNRVLVPGEKDLPANVDAERFVLGSVLLDDS
jgi:hypothetical protein